MKVRDGRISLIPQMIEITKDADRREGPRPPCPAWVPTLFSPSPTTTMQDLHSRSVSPSTLGKPAYISDHLFHLRNTSAAPATWGSKCFTNENPYNAQNNYTRQALLLFLFYMRETEACQDSKMCPEAHSWSVTLLIGLHSTIWPRSFRGYFNFLLYCL